MRLHLRRAHPLLLVVVVALVAAACSSPDGTNGTSTTSSAPVTTPDDCEERLPSLAEALRPNIAYDYEPAVSPIDLADRVAVVFTAGTIVDADLVGDRVVLELEGVEVIRDAREGDRSIPATIAFDVGPGFDSLPVFDDFDGMSVLVFAHEWDQAPGGLIADIEGLWLACGTESAARSVIASPVGEGWPGTSSIAGLAAAVADPGGSASELIRTTRDDLSLIVLPDATGTLPDDLVVTCPGGPSFPASALDEIGALEGSGRDDVEAQAREWLDTGEGDFWPQEGWLVLDETDDRVLLVHPGEQDGSIWFMTIERSGEEWRWSGGSNTGDGCPLQVTLREPLGRVEWRVDPTQPTSPEDAAVTVLATERDCASGRPMGDRLLGPEVVMTDTEVLIAFAVVPRPGGQECPSNPEQTVVVELPAPLGDRELVDGLSVSGTLGDFLP